MASADGTNKLLALVAALAIALGATSCGSSDDGDSGDPSEPKAATETTTAGGGSETAAAPEDQVIATFGEIQTDFRAGEYRSVCANLTARGAAQTVASDGGRYQSCVAFVRAAGQLMRRSGSKTFRPSVLEVRVSGDRAVAKVKVGETKTRNYVFAEQDGSWKLDQALQ